MAAGGPPNVGRMTDVDAAETLTRAIESRDATVAVIGLGYVGLPLLDTMAAAGFRAIGLDDDRAKIDALLAGRNYLPHLGPDLPERLMASGRVRLTSEHRDLADADAVLICVPTPLDEAHEPDHGYVRRAALAVHERAVNADPRRPRLVVLESTTYPGATRGIVAPVVRGRHADTPIFVAFSPEREDPGRADLRTHQIPKLVGGIDGPSAALALALYRAAFERVVPCASAEVAEAAKLVENVYRAVNIALVNELKVSLDAMGLDVWEVLDAAATKPFGFQRFDPGPGFGGHCVPIDPFYLSHRAREVGAETEFIELAGRINRGMPGWVVGKVRGAIEAGGGALAGSRVLVLGMAYKRNIADVRESPAFELIALLREAGAEVSYHDPHIPRTWPGRRHDLGMESVELTPGTLASADAVVVATDHDAIDWTLVGRHATLVVDTRNAMARAEAPISARVVRA